MAIEMQLELNLEDKTSDEMKLHLMQRKLDEMHESSGKVRRKIFQELGEMKRVFVDIQKENQDLKIRLQRMAGERDEWVYLQGEYLFQQVGT